MEMLEKVAAVYPKAAVGAMNTEELWQLCAGEEERHAGLESCHHALRNKINDHSCFHQPCDERH